MARCEDYPCCGHTDGLPCDWTYTPSPHDGCDHNAGYCQVDEDDDDIEEDDEIQSWEDTRLVTPDDIAEALRLAE
jgi:hypothetical protein